MALSLADKKAVVEEVAAIAKNASSVTAVHYKGMTVEHLTSLRKEARKKNVEIKVVRNTLAKRAFEGTPFESINHALVEQLLLAFSMDAPGVAARLLRDAAKENDKIQVRAFSVGGQYYDASALNAIAELPTREEALSQLLYVMKAPIEQFARVLSAVPTKLVRTVDAIREAKQQ